MPIDLEKPLTEEELIDFFSPFGTVLDVAIGKHVTPNIAFVLFESLDSVQIALRNKPSFVRNGAIWPLNVEEIKSEKRSGSHTAITSTVTSTVTSATVEKLTADRNSAPAADLSLTAAALASSGSKCSDISDGQAGAAAADRSTSGGDDNDKLALALADLSTLALADPSTLAMADPSTLVDPSSLAHADPASLALSIFGDSNDEITTNFRISVVRVENDLALIEDDHKKYAPSALEPIDSNIYKRELFDRGHVDDDRLRFATVR